jgi:ribonuclease P protein component
VVVLDKASGPTRLGLAVGRKVGGAVVRNRVKRLIREFFRLHYADLAPHADIVVVAKPGAAALSYAQLCGELALILTGRSLPRDTCPEESPSR